MTPASNGHSFSYSNFAFGTSTYRGFACRQGVSRRLALLFTVECVRISDKRALRGSMCTIQTDPAAVEGLRWDGWCFVHGRLRRSCQNSAKASISKPSWKWYRVARSFSKIGTEYTLSALFKSGQACVWRLAFPMMRFLIAVLQWQGISREFLNGLSLVLRLVPPLIMSDWWT